MVNQLAKQQAPAEDPQQEDVVEDQGVQETPPNQNGQQLTAVQQRQQAIQRTGKLFGQQLATMRDRFSMALPKHMPVERFERVLLTAVQMNPDLLFCTRSSLFNAAMRAAQDGLLPDGREGAIVPFKKQASWLPMVFGIRKKVRNSGELVDWDVHLVYEKDEFQYEFGDNAFIFHRPFFGKGSRGDLLGGYSIAHLKDGGTSRDVMTIDEVEEIRQQSSRARSEESPWNVKAFYPEMVKKTIAKRHAKSLPMSSDLDDLIRRDDHFEQNKPEIAGAPDADSGQAARLSLGSALDQLAQKEDPPESETTTIEQTAQEAKSAETEAKPAQEATKPAEAKPEPKPEPAKESENPAPAAAETSKPKAPAKKPANDEGSKLPTTENEYRLFAKNWIDATKIKAALRERWVSPAEKKLRNAANVSAEAREEIYEYLIEMEKKLAP